MAEPSAAAMTADDTRFFGHPRGLATLFMTEMWERFSYYGMRAFLLFYMVAPVSAGGMGMADADGTSVLGTYTSSAWLAAIFGGIVADRWLGQYKSVLVGGILITLGHFSLAFHGLALFYGGLALIVVGTGLLKANASTLVGSLYAPGDTRRDAGFSIFYMGINLGALIGPLIAGYLAQRVDWHAGFACAGVGMALGLTQYVLGRKHLKAAADRLAAMPKPAPAAGAEADKRAFTGEEWKRMGAIVVLFVFAALFWGSYEQAASTLSLFADRYTRLEIAGFAFPSSWFQSVQPVFVILLAPLFAWLWMRLGRHEPSSPAKFAWALFFAGLAFLILVPAGSYAQSGPGVRVSPWWLIAAYFVTELGELCLSPVGLSAVTKLAPVRIVGLMMGVWFLSNSAGNKLAGWAGGFFSTIPLDSLFGWVAGISFAAAIIMFLLVKPVRRLMGGVL
jgi:POT family proton-dependent oligopeptide transporter